MLSCQDNLQSQPQRLHQMFTLYLGLTQCILSHEDITNNNSFYTLFDRLMSKSSDSYVNMFSRHA